MFVALLHSSRATMLTIPDNNIRISDEWIHKYERQNEAVKLPDGGYLGMLNVMHELHCIVRVTLSD